MELEKKRHPKNLYVLSMGELAERFCYYGTQTVIVLYLVNHFKFTTDNSYEIFAIYAAFATILPLFGGIIADRYLSLTSAIVIGMVLLITGNLVLSAQHVEWLYFGLSLTLLGTGMYKTNVTALVGRLYQDNDEKKQRGYTVFYTFINIGATAGPISYGLLISFAGWQYCFLINALLISLGLLLYFIAFDKTKITPIVPQSISPLESVSKTKAPLSIGLIIKLIIMLLMLLLIVKYALDFPDESSLLFGMLTVFVGSYVTYVIYYQPRKYLRPLFILLFLCVCITAFFAISLQVGSSVNIYIDQFINRMVLSWQVPTIMFASLYPISVIIMVGPITLLWDTLAKRNIHLTSMDKFKWGVTMLVFCICRI